MENTEKPDGSQPLNQGEEPKSAAQLAPPELTPLGWLQANAVHLVLFGLAIWWLYSNYGVDGVIKASLVVLGLGFVIFIHELGHFLAAKWCDVHVKTFSIGFGPALPGCSFRRGETHYLIGILPLGGYVSMVGESAEAEASEEYPRSFKNKSVGQRMVIISAGVIMNLILGAICFITVYRLHGVPRPPAIVWRIDNGSPSWQAGVKTGSAIVELNGIKNPTFDDLRLAVALSSHGSKIPFTFVPYDGGKPLQVSLEPRRGKNDMVPLIGVAPPPRAILYPYSPTGKTPPARANIPPYIQGSSASKGRVVALQNDDVITGVSNPANPEQFLTIAHEVKTGAFDYQAVMNALTELAGKPTRIQCVKKGGGGENPRTVDIPVEGFRGEDAIVGATNPDQVGSYNPFEVTSLPPTRSKEPRKEGDFFALESRLRKLAGKPVVLEVLRNGGEGARDRILVPPSYHRQLGLIMKIGEIAQVRTGSDAEKAGILPGDRLTEVELISAKGESVKIPLDNFDAMRLPWALETAAGKTGDCKAVVTVGRIDPTTHKALMPIRLQPISWNRSFDGNQEDPVKPPSPMSIPQLGITFRVENTVLQVAPNSPAKSVDLRPFDVIEQVCFAKVDRKTGKETWDKWTELKSLRESNQPAFDQWAFFFSVLQERELPKMQFKVRRAGEAKLLEVGPLSPVTDPTWPYPEIGLVWVSDFVMQKADTAWEALTFGANDTFKSVRAIYQNLASLLTGRISTDSLGGPIEIASQTFSAAEDTYSLILFLGMISINLAVVNFLPIPVLDGGHMVFLIYEKIRGKPPSDAVLGLATYTGLAIVLSLMVFVFYLDIKRRFF